MITRVLRASLALLVMFLFFFGVPILFFTIMTKFYGIRLPVKLVMNDIYLVVIAKLIVAASFVIIYAMLIEHKRTGRMLYGMILALLMFMAGALSDSVVSYAFYDLPYDYSRLNVIGNAVAYMLAGLSICKIYSPPGPKIYT
jgi:hypothetical protein